MADQYPLFSNFIIFHFFINMFDARAIVIVRFERMNEQYDFLFARTMCANVDSPFSTWLVPVPAIFVILQQETSNIVSNFSSKTINSLNPHERNAVNGFIRVTSFALPFAGFACGRQVHSKLRLSRNYSQVENADSPGDMDFPSQRSPRSNTCYHLPS